MFVLNVNPEPWKVPPFYPSRGKGGIGVRPGRDEGNALYKEAVKEELVRLGAVMREPPYHMHFLFYRNLATYDTGKRMETKKFVDSTNMQKLTEDACQDLVINNDTHNRFVSSQIVEQGTDTDQTVVIFLSSGLPDHHEIWIPPGFEPAASKNLIASERESFLNSEVITYDNSWPPKPI